MQSRTIVLISAIYSERYYHEYFTIRKPTNEKRALAEIMGGVMERCWSTKIWLNGIHTSQWFTKVQFDVNNIIDFANINFRTVYNINYNYRIKKITTTPCNSLKEGKDNWSMFGLGSGFDGCYLLKFWRIFKHQSIVDNMRHFSTRKQFIHDLCMDAESH